VAREVSKTREKKYSDSKKLVLIQNRRGEPDLELGGEKGEVRRSTVEREGEKPLA